MSTTEAIGLKFIKKLCPIEGGYVNDPTDSGGETNHGITVAVAREYGYKGRMIDLTKEQATEIYMAKYWRGPRFDQVALQSEDVSWELFDTGVNCGVSVASEILQRCLNVFNNQATYYADISTDGRIGPATLGALQKFLAKRGKPGELTLLKALNCLQGERYISLAERRQKDEAFVYGWVSNRVELPK